MSVHAGDNATYTPARGAPELVRVEALTAKRVTITIWREGVYLVRHVKPGRLERRGGGC